MGFNSGMGYNSGMAQAANQDQNALGLSQRTISESQETSLAQSLDQAISVMESSQGDLSLSMHPENKFD